MSEATRYTTRPERVLGVRALLLNPGWLAAVALLVLGSACRLSDDLSVNLAMVGGVASAAGWLYWRHFTPSALVTRAMVDHGLVFRRPDGAVQIPRRVGRVRRDGRNHRVRWALPSGITLKDVQDRVQALEHQCFVGLHAWVADGQLHADILRHHIPERVEFDDFYAGPRPSGRLVAGLGRGKRGALWCDLASLPHLLVGGETGGGKSVFLRQLLTHLLLTHGPEHLRLTVVDLKGGIELHPYSTLPHSTGPVAGRIATAADALDRPAGTSTNGSRSCGQDGTPTSTPGMQRDCPPGPVTWWWLTRWQSSQPGASARTAGRRGTRQPAVCVKSRAWGVPLVST